MHHVANDFHQDDVDDDEEESVGSASADSADEGNFEQIVRFKVLTFDHCRYKNTVVICCSLSYA